MRIYVYKCRDIYFVRALRFVFYGIFITLLLATVRYLTSSSALDIFFLTPIPSYLAKLRIIAEHNYSRFAYFRLCTGSPIQSRPKRYRFFLLLLPSTHCNSFLFFSVSSLYSLRVLRTVFAPVSFFYRFLPRSSSKDRSRETLYHEVHETVDKLFDRGGKKISFSPLCIPVSRNCYQLQSQSFGIILRK